MTQNYITDDTTIRGNVTTGSSMTVAGVIEGDLTAGGEVIVLEDALVKGDISGPDIRIAGKVEGRINASGKLVISSVGQVVGDIAVRALLIEDGGTLQGQCQMGASGPSGANGQSKQVPAPSVRPS
jgi:cytoskeletal protein CcmA (bactofilin family)